MEFLDSVRTQQDSLRVLADLTGGLAVVNQNEVTKAVGRIDQETSDYYLVGYYSRSRYHEEAPHHRGSRSSGRAQSSGTGRRTLRPQGGRALGFGFGA